MKLFKYAFQAFRFCLSVFLVNTIFRYLYKREIWIIREKRTEARDNGYHFFKYVRENHKEINIYYAITKDSADLNKIQTLGNVIHYNSLKHCLYFLAAKYSISSQQGGAYPFERGVYERLKFLVSKKQKCIFIQHGITKDNMSGLDFKVAKYALFTTSALKEKEFIEKNYKYPDGIVQCLGLCRFDNLYHNENKVKKVILVMPTFRGWLVADDVTKEATNKNKEMFIKDEYYNNYVELLNNEQLSAMLHKYSYEIIFYPHYSLQSYSNLFKESITNPDVVVADRFNYDVQDLLISCSVLITDFSSVFFDFAYMKKPEIFFQFDEEKYREYHYAKGYFSYNDDGFGPVVKSIDDLLKELEKILQNNAIMEQKYLKRSDEFFTLRDDKNCKRTYDAIVSLN